MSPNTMKELTKADVSLKTRQDQLVKSQKVLARKNRELSETNRVLALIARKLDQNKKASAREKELFICEDTVKTHRRNIRRKLGFKNTRTDLKITFALKGMRSPHMFKDNFSAATLGG